ncbi:hypothetical protein BH23PAT1_BH23PAT1_2130 [soil metagenome]
MIIHPTNAKSSDGAHTLAKQGLTRFFKYGAAGTVLLICALVLSNSAVGAQNVQQFTFSSFEADYYLTKDNDGRSSLRVVEKLVAEFPDYDQNKGIVRAIPMTYAGHPVSFELQSLKRNGKPEPVYSQSVENKNIVIGTGTDDYVHGTQTYEFTYTMRDVTRDFGEYQEFFWDTNGTQWRQPFDRLKSRVHLDETTKDLFTGEVICFEGRQGSLDKCSTRTDGNTTVFESSGRLGIAENVTMLMKFEPGAFEPYKEGAAGVIRSIVATSSFGLMATALLFALRLKLKYRDAKGRGTIVPEYLPPKDISALLAAGIYGKKVLKKAVAAQIVELAVRRKIKIIENIEKRLFKKSVNYTIALENNRDLRPEESEIINVFFKDAAPGAQYKFKTADPTISSKMQSVQKSLKEKVVYQGYRYKAKGVAWPYLIAASMSAIALGLFIELQNVGIEGWRVAPLPISVFVLLLIVMIIGAGPRPLTEKGRNIVDYLKGLEDYIKLAEAERLRVLQSPSGALKTSIDANDKQQVVKLYERLLPYAVLFGHEKEWAKQLSLYYEQQHTVPSWYAGTTAFNASNFSSSISSFSASTSSSSSGFSGGGGGGSGGGGGGGGGGGR